MGIKVLAPEVISKIAAGEVVERPASVVKELVENSLDAGATQITVEANGGGIPFIRVTDNGIGIPSDQIELAFERYATSKIASEADLTAISTLGFRGEALPSIAAVAEVSMITRYEEELAGMFVYVKNGVIVNKNKRGCPKGTTVTVRNLFRNIPARLKFLKSSTTESNHIAHLVSQYSLAFPEVKFNLILNGRVILRSPGNGNLKDVLAQIYGLDVAQAMLQVDSGENRENFAPQISGFISPPSLHRASRGYLSFFVNRRWIQSRRLIHAVEEAYQNMLMTGRHPIGVINIFLPPQEVDVNVHPAKSEVRFHHEHEVFGAVQKAVGEALINFSPIPSVKAFPQPPAAPPSELRPKPIFSPRKTEATSPVIKGEITPLTSKLPILRVIGQFHNTYVVAEGPEGIYLIDQHAAHERILYERIREQQESQTIEVQGLLSPITVEVTAQQDEILSSQGEVLAQHGFTLEKFGERTYLLRSVPALLKSEELTQVLFEIIDALAEERRANYREKIAASLACHGAIKAGQMLSPSEMEELIRQLEQTQSPRTCPHGRPTMIHFTASQLEKEFGRR